MNKYITNRKEYNYTNIEKTVQRLDSEGNEDEMTNYVLEYRDGSYVNKEKQVAFAGLNTCFVCRDEHGIGFHVKNENEVDSPFPMGSRGSLIGFVCINCAFEFLKRNGYDIESSQDLCKVNIEVPRRYANLYMRFKKNKVAVDSFETMKEKYSQFIHADYMQTLEYLVDLDVEYGENIHLSTQWRGWWMGLTGDEVRFFFAWIQQAIELNKDPRDCFREERGDKKIKIPNCIWHAGEIYNKYYA